MFRNAAVHPAHALGGIRAKPRGARPRKPRDFSTAAKQLHPLLEDAARSHLIADVPVGLFLSSGLDSGAIAALAGRLQPNILSFTLSFPGTPYDEAPLARLVAERCGTQHREIPLDGDAVLSRLDEALAALDQPTMDGINTYFVSWAAREVGLKVALSGLGGDELFAGYRTFADTPKLERLVRLAWFAPAPLRRAVAPVLRGLLARRGGPMPRARPQTRGCCRTLFRILTFFARALFPVRVYPD